jgi:spore photoproduct lyase family protein
MVSVKNVYYQDDIFKFNRGVELYNKYKNTCQMIKIDSHWKIDGLNNNASLAKYIIKTKSDNLILGVKSALTARPNCRSTDFIAPSHSWGCAMACVYCYAHRRKGYANPITIFVNIDKIKNYLIGKDNRLGKKAITEENIQTDPTYWTFDIGENCDCSVDAMLSDNVKDLIQLFTKLNNSKASFATKFVNNDLLNYNPQGKTRIRFSLMPSKVSKCVDVKTTPIIQRIKAINDFVKAGYEVHINLSPVIIYEGWEKDYEELFCQINDLTNDDSKKQLKAEVIFLTHNEKLHDFNMQWHPKAEKDYLWRYKDENGNNKFSLPVLQQRKLSQNGMVNLRYKNNYKQEGINSVKAMMDKYIPYCAIRYIF